MIESTVNELSKYSMQAHKGDLSTICAEDLISTSASFHEDQALGDAIKTLIKTKVTGHAVTNKNKELVGFLSEKDCLKHLFADSFNEMNSGTIKESMCEEVITLNKDDSIYHIIELFLSRPYQMYPVVDGAKFIGCVKRSDVLKSLAKRGQNL